MFGDTLRHPSPPGGGESGLGVPGQITQERGHYCRPLDPHPSVGPGPVSGKGSRIPRAGRDDFVVLVTQPHPPDPKFGGDDSGPTPRGPSCMCVRERPGVGGVDVSFSVHSARDPGTTGPRRGRGTGSGRRSDFSSESRVWREEWREGAVSEGDHLVPGGRDTAGTDRVELVSDCGLG